MISILRRTPRLPSAIAFVAAALLLAGAPPKVTAAEPGAESSTAPLLEVKGVQAIISLRHPKLVGEDLEKLMNAVPETGMLRMVLGQLADDGYPDFPEIAAGSNIGAAVLPLADSDPKAKFSGPTVIGFAKLTEGGKIWSALSEQHLVLQKHGDWTLIAQDSAVLARLKSPDAVIAYLEKPQAEDLRFWVRTSPEFFSWIKQKSTPAFKAHIADYPELKRKAALAYFDVFFALLAQLHSVDARLAFTDHGLVITNAAQFLPGTPLGIFLSSKVGPIPAVAGYVSADSFMTLVNRNNPEALHALSDSIMDALIAVDYPPMSEQLKKFKAAYAAVASASEGGDVVTIDLALSQENGRAQIKKQLFSVQPAHASSELARDYLKQSQIFNSPVANLLKPHSPAMAALGTFENHSSYTENALTIEGIAFDRLVASTTFNGVNGKVATEITEYIGVVDGDIVMADSEATLRARLPALRARTVLADGIRIPDVPGECCRMALNGGKLVDLLASAAKLDLKDPEVWLQLGNLKAQYAASGPVVGVVNSDQSRITGTLSIPYPFISASVHLGTYMNAHKLDFIHLLTPAVEPAMPLPPTPPSFPSLSADWNRRYAHGKQLAAEGKADEALGEYLWCYDKGARLISGRGNPRLTSLLASIAALGKTYPPALQALHDRSAQAKAWIDIHPGDGLTLSKLVAVNRALQEDAATLAYFDQLPADSLTRTLLVRLLYTQFIEVKRYADALKAKSYGQYFREAGRLRQLSQNLPAGSPFLKTQAAYLADLGASEAEALAGTGDEIHARLIITELRQADPSPATLLVLQTHLARAGHGDWVAGENKPVANPAQP